MKIFWEIFASISLRFIRSKAFIFISGYSVTALLHWRHFIAAITFVDLTTFFLITFEYLIIVVISFLFSKILSNFFSAKSDNHPFYVTWFVTQFVLLALFASYQKYESRVSVYHQVMKIAPYKRGAGVSDVVKQCQLFMMKEEWDNAHRECLKGSFEGHSEAQTNLAYLYIVGLGPLEHEPEGSRPSRRLWKFITRELLSKALEDPFKESPKISSSEANLQAERLLKKAADKGFLAAQYNLGVFYIGGNAPYPEIGEKDYRHEEEKAAKYTRLAAMQGDAEAIYNLAVMYDQGMGVRQDRQIADRLYLISASKGFELAKMVVWLNGI